MPAAAGGDRRGVAEADRPVNVAQTGFGVAVALGAAAALVALLAPVRVRPALAGVGTSIAGVSGLTAGIAAMAGQSFTVIRMQ